MKTQIKLFLFALSVIVSINACRKDINPETTAQLPASTEICKTCSEEAFPDIKGEVLRFKNDKNQELMVVKKGEHYIYLGDVVLNEQSFNDLKRNFMGDTTGRTATSATNRLWPNRTVFFTIAAGTTGQNRITEAIAHWEAVTNLRFQPRTNQANWIEFFNGNGCFSTSIGMAGGRQQISLGAGCTTGNTIHEIGHAIGFYHEQSRADRDNDIIINWNNIQNGAAPQFQTYVQRNEPGFELCGFDFGSIMLYGSFAFSANNQPTITRRDGTTFVGQRNGLSAGDIQTYNYMYNPTIFARMERNTLYQSEEWYYDYQTAEFTVRLYSDAACTIPFTPTTCPVRINYSYVEQYQGQSWGSNYTVQYPGTLTFGIGVNTIYMGDLTTSDCRYGASGDIEGTCIYRYYYVSGGMGYTPR
jgi:uncharacterized lipoprotein YehR (DUF1307 family)